MRLPRSLLGPLRLLRLPRTLSETVRLLPPSAAASPAPSASAAPPASSTVQGWVASLRTSKNIAFLGVNDGTLDRPLQVVVLGKKSAGGLRSIVEELSIGASVKVTGPILPSPGPGQPIELQASALEVLGPCNAETYPIHPDHNVGAERPIHHLREHAHLRPRELETQSIIKVRDKVNRECRKFFDDHDFIHINTPILTSADCEGAGEAFSVFSPTSPKDDPFFPSGANLTVSSQLHLELYLPTHPRVYTLSPAFRAETGISRRHLAEFWMLEAEVAFVTSVDEVMDVCEEGVKSVLRSLVADDGASLGVFGKREDVRTRLDQAIGSEEGAGWPRLSYTEAIEILQRHQEAAAVDAKPFESDPVWGTSISSEQEKYLAGEHAKGPLFVYDYPSALKPFYMLPTPGGEGGERATVACFDLLVPGVGELAGGSLREHRLKELVETIEQRKMRMESMEWYLDTRRFGTVPHGGYGLGFERLLSWVTGVKDVRDVVGFGRWKGNCRY